MHKEVPFGDSFASRLRQAAGGMTQLSLSKATGVPQTSINKYFNGQAEPGVNAAYKIAKVLDIDLDWLVSGEGIVKGSQRPVWVARYDVRLSAGSGSFSKGSKMIGSMPFDTDMLMGLGIRSSDRLGVLEAEGDSMEPIITDGARVLIDFEDTRLREAIFAFRLGDELRLKRLRRLIDGVEILSENPRYPPEQLTGQRLEDFAVIGRAIWAGSKL